MARFGYALSSEEHGPGDLLLNGRIAEESGFDFLSISDHFHPWISRQGNSPCLLYTSPSPRDRQKSRMPSSA